MSTTDNTIIVNRKARHDYFIEDTYEAGIVLQGWEVKSLRAGRVNLTDSYVLLKDGEAWLLGCNITALPTVSTHIHPDPTRTRKLLLNQRELNKFYGSIEREGYTAIVLSLYWKNGLAKAKVAIAKGKKQYDKREAEKDRDWQRQKQRITGRG